MAGTGTSGVMDNVEPPDEEFTDQRKFLNAIHPMFLELVFPFECGLVDQLKAGHAFDSEDEDIIRGEKSRRNRARQCWSLLSKVPPKRFLSHCVPALQDTCPRVVHGKTLRWREGGEECLRHHLRKLVPLRRLADMFPGASGCTHEEYRKIIDGSNFDDALWVLVFQLCSRNKDNATFRSMMETTLKSHEIAVPPDLPIVLSRGVPCVCLNSETKKRQKNFKEKKNEKKFKKARCQTEMERHYNASTSEIFPLTKGPRTLRTKEQSSRSQSAAMAADNLNNNAGGGPAEEEAEEEDEEYCFESVEQKEIFLKQLEKFNKTIRKVSGMKAVFHEVSGIQMEITVLGLQTRPETSQELGLLYKGKTVNLRAKIRDIREKLQRDYEEAWEMMSEMEPVGSDAVVPSNVKMTLTERKEVLVTEFKEAQSFYQKSCDIFNQLNLDQKGLLKPERIASDAKPSIYESHNASEDEYYDDPTELEVDSDSFGFLMDVSYNEDTGHEGQLDGEESDLTDIETIESQGFDLTDIGTPESQGFDLTSEGLEVNEDTPNNNASRVSGGDDDVDFFYE